MSIRSFLYYYFSLDWVVFVGFALGVLGGFYVLTFAVFVMGECFWVGFFGFFGVGFFRWFLVYLGGFSVFAAVS